MKPKNNDHICLCLLLEPTQKVLITSEGKSYAELLKDGKDHVAQEEVGEVLSLRKLGEKNEIQIRVKAVPKADALKDVMKSKLPGA